MKNLQIEPQLIFRKLLYQVYWKGKMTFIELAQIDGQGCQKTVGEKHFKCGILVKCFLLCEKKQYAAAMFFFKKSSNQNTKNRMKFNHVLKCWPLNISPELLKRLRWGSRYQSFRIVDSSTSRKNSLRLLMKNIAMYRVDHGPLLSAGLSQFVDQNFCCASSCH